MEVIRQMQTDGADFIFLHSKNDDYHKLNPRAMFVPVFSLMSQNVITESFMNKISDSEKEVKKSNPHDKKVRSLRNTPAVKLFITIAHRVRKTDYTESHLICSLANVRSFDFAKAISIPYTKLQTYITFEPMVVVYKRPSSITKKSKNCYEATLYCAADPDRDGRIEAAMSF